ncbi:MAG: helix-turn-helix transcriptional regulator [Oscillospiraceae bacterium]|nr:helix-turn-helix transcriptional regulator [Oscillospiraceae bacterium]
MLIDYCYIGDRIKTVRKHKRITQEKLAEAMDVSVGYVSQIERGITKPNLEMLARISQVLGCSLCYFLNGAETVREDYLLPELVEKLQGFSETKRRVLLRIIDVLEQELK